MNKKVQEYIEKLGVLEKPEILSMTKEQIPSILLRKSNNIFWKGNVSVSLVTTIQMVSVLHQLQYGVYVKSQKV